MKRKTMILVVLLLAVGFAAISTTLYINGSTKINPNQEDFNVYFSNSFVNNIEDKNIITSDTTIDFETEFEMINQEYVLDYEITNASRNYNAEIKIECTNGNEYLSVLNEFDEENVLEAQSRRMGKLIVKQIKSYVGEDLTVSITCTINANAVERDELAEEGIAGLKDYMLSGYLFDETNKAKTNANLVIFSDTPHYVTTNANGYFYVYGLERGNHEIYYVDDTIENIKNMSKDEIIEKSISSSNFTTTSKVIEMTNSYKIDSPIIQTRNSYCKDIKGTTWEFLYYEGAQKFTVPCDGEYKVEL